MLPSGNDLLISRRHLLGIGAGALVSLSPITTLAATRGVPHRSVFLRDMRTSRSLDVVYWEGDGTSRSRCGGSTTFCAITGPVKQRQ